MSHQPNQHRFHKHPQRHSASGEITRRGRYPICSDEHHETRPLPVIPLEIRRPDFGDQWNARASEAERRLIEEIEMASRDAKKLGPRFQKKYLELYALRASRAPVSRIPGDVLKLIFEEGAEFLRPFTMSRHAAPPFQVACSLVCRHWRHLCLETSNLWSQFTIQDDRSLGIAVDYLSNRFPNPRFQLKVNIECAIYRPHAIVEDITAFISVNASRLVALDLTMCEHAIDVFWTGMTGRPSALETCNIKSSSACLHTWHPMRPRVGLPQLPDLRQLRLNGWSVTRTFSQLPTLSSLIIEDVGIEQSLLRSIFFSCPNLRELAVARISGREHEDCVYAPVNLDNLHTLKMLYNGSEILLWSSSYLQMPALQHLEIMHHNTSNSLTIQALLEMLERQVTLTHLVLCLPSTVTADIIDAIAKPSGETAALLPALVDLHLRCVDNALNGCLDDSLCSSLINMVTKRIDGGCRLHNLKVYPCPEEDKCEWLGSKLHFLTGNKFGP